MLSDQQRRLKRAKQRERDAGHWLLKHDGEDPHWKRISSSTGRVGHISQFQFDVISATYAGEVKNIKLPKKLIDFWIQIVQVAAGHHKEPALIIYPSNQDIIVQGFKKRLPAMHIITEERHAELLDLEKRYYAVMEDMPVDFKDMFPSWGQEEED